MMRDPLTRVEDAPLVCDIRWAARFLNRSVSDIKRDLRDGCMEPAPMPSSARRQRKQPRQWSRFALESWLRGDYLHFVQHARQGASRSFFTTVKRKEATRGRLAVSA